MYFSTFRVFPDPKQSLDLKTSEFLKNSEVLDSSGFGIIQARGTVEPVDDSPHETARQPQGEDGQRESDSVGGGDAPRRGEDDEDTFADADPVERQRQKDSEIQQRDEEHQICVVDGQLDGDANHPEGKYV